MAFAIKYPRISSSHPSLNLYFKMTILPLYKSSHTGYISFNHSAPYPEASKFSLICKFLRPSCVQYTVITSKSLTMLKHFQLRSWNMLVSSPPTSPCSPKTTSFESERRCFSSTRSSTFNALNNISKPRVYLNICCSARRRVRYDDDEDEDEDEENEEQNKEIALLELYSQSVRGEALIVHAVVDDQLVEVLIFKVRSLPISLISFCGVWELYVATIYIFKSEKYCNTFPFGLFWISCMHKFIFQGFSSCLSYRTSPDPSKSIIPARAVIKSIDRVRGPFDPSNIEYLQKDLSWEVFKSTLLPPNLQMYI